MASASSAISDVGASCGHAPTVGSPDDRTDQPAGRGGRRWRIHRRWHISDSDRRTTTSTRTGPGTPPTPRRCAGPASGRSSWGCPPIAFTEHLDFTVWDPDDRATDEGLVERHASRHAEIDVEGYFAELTEVPRPVPRAAHLVRRRDRRAAPVRRPASPPTCATPRSTGSSARCTPWPKDGRLVRRRPPAVAGRRRHDAPLPRRAGGHDREQRRLPGARARRLPAPLLARAARTATWRRTTRRSTGRSSARWPRTGRALEVNTTSPLASVDQIRWFHEEGGEAVSFGSDAHHPLGGRPALRPRRRRRGGGRLPARTRPLRLLAPLNPCAQAMRGKGTVTGGASQATGGGGGGVRVTAVSGKTKR